mmetsp:Transcript_35845/g.83407  ORF Transcript_35845/g.83407 Transcript_35845/m.83407 type:complete len:100 (-) Transcript_35845:177-476(-)
MGLQASSIACCMDGGATPVSCSPVRVTRSRSSSGSPLRLGRVTSNSKLGRSGSVRGGLGADPFHLRSASFGSESPKARTASDRKRQLDAWTQFGVAYSS